MPKIYTKWKNYIGGEGRMGSQFEIFNGSAILVEPDDPDLIVRKYLPDKKEYLKFYVYYDDGKNRERLLTITILDVRGRMEGGGNGKANRDSAV
jgi:hypothetical protein